MHAEDVQPMTIAPTPGEGFPPEQRRNSDLRQPEHGVVARKRGGNGEGRCDGRAQKDLSHTCEGDLSDAERERSNDNGGKECAKDAGATMKSGHAGDQPDEERQRIYREREDQPAEQADPRKGENESEGKHGGGSRDKACDGRAFHHHRGALRSLAANGLNRERNSGSASV